MLARVDAGTEALRFEPVEANRFARQVGDKWKATMRLALLEFTVETEPAPAFLSADTNSLQRLLTILLDNALRYTPPGGSVNLRVARQNGRVVFDVHDTGIGIAPEHQSKVFERFYRVDRRRDGVSGGSGLGLALAKWIAEKHGATLSLASTVGKGTSFQFALREVLPASPNLAAPEFVSGKT
jgi:signal transduction histidine kinase